MRQDQDVAQDYRYLHQIADDIRQDWREPFYGAVPYIDAMRYLTTMDARMGHDTARDVVQYFLSNAGTWHGPVARRVKVELRAMLLGRPVPANGKAPARDVGA